MPRKRKLTSRSTRAEKDAENERRRNARERKRKLDLERVEVARKKIQTSPIGPPATVTSHFLASVTQSEPRKPSQEEDTLFEKAENGATTRFRSAHAHETIEEATRRRAATVAEAVRKARANETQEQKERRLAANAEATRRVRANETPYQKQKRRAANAAARRKARANETQEQKNSRLASDAAATRKRRLEKRAQQERAVHTEGTIVVLPNGRQEHLYIV